MPRRGNSQSSYVFKNHVVVAQVSDTAWAHCSITLRLERTHSRGMLSIRFTAEYEGFNSAQYVSLYLTPHNIHWMDASFSTERIPPRIAEHIRQHIPVRSLDEILILSVSTSAPGCVICPRAAATLTPVAAYEPNVRCFQDICRATEIRLYIPAPNLSPSRQLALDEFIRMTNANELAPIDINLQRRRGQETTWEVFDVPEPPPSYIPPQTEKSTGKRTRQASPSSASTAAAKRAASGDGPAPSPSSRTHVSNTTDFNTDSDSDSDSDSECLTYASPGPKQQHQRESDSNDFNKAIVGLRGMVAIELATLLPDMIRNLLPGILPEMLPEMLRTHLSDTLHGQDSQSEDSYQDEQDNRPSSPLITNYVQPLVLAHLPSLVKKYMNEQVDTNDIIGIAENNVTEECDYCLTSIREARDECLKEIAAAGTDACDRLRDVYCDGDGIRGLTPEESSGMGAERMAPLGPGLPQGSSSQGSSFKFRRCGKERRQRNGAEPVLVEQTLPGGNYGQQDPSAQLVLKAMTTENDDTTDEGDMINEEDNTADEEDMHDGEDGMTDEEDDATAGHGDLGPTTLGDYEPGRQDERDRLHELVQNGSINAAGGTGHDTAAPAPPVSTLFMHPEMTDQGDGDVDVDDGVETVSMHLQATNPGNGNMCDETETGCSPTQEDSGMSARVEAYRRHLHVSASTVEANIARLRSPEVWQQESFPSGPDMQIGGNVRSAASTQADEGSCSGTQLQYAQVVDSRFSVPSDRSSQAQPDTRLRRREDP